MELTGTGVACGHRRSHFLRRCKVRYTPPLLRQGREQSYSHTTAFRMRSDIDHSRGHHGYATFLSRLARFLV